MYKRQTTGRTAERIALVEAYSKAQGLFATRETPDPVFTDTLELDLSSVKPSMAGPKRPEGRVDLSGVKAGFAAAMDSDYKKGAEIARRVEVEGEDFDLGHGDVVIAPVSYTHLDVYKRQPPYTAAGARTTGRRPPCVMAGLRRP